MQLVPNKIYLKEEIIKMIEEGLKLDNNILLLCLEVDIVEYVIIPIRLDENINKSILESIINEVKERYLFDPNMFLTYEESEEIQNESFKQYIERISKK